MEKNNNEFKDQTTEFRILKKHKKDKTIIIEDEEEFKDLEDTRELRKITSKNGLVITRYHPKLDNGLSLTQIEERRKQGLVNKSKHHYDKSYLQIIIKNLFTYLNILLYLICVILIIFKCENYSNYFFVLIITSNLVIGIFQEIKAKKTIDKLSLEAKSSSKVIRNGIAINLNPDELVLDDIIIFSTGNKIVTDCIVKDGCIEVNESLLTGESLPIKKCVGDQIFAGSFVSSGTAICQVERIGSDNYITQLQERAKKEKKNNSVILKALNWIIGIVGTCVIPLGIYLFCAAWANMGWTTEWSSLQTIVFKTCSSMVAMIPSGLYLTTSMALVVSVINLAMKKTLVQDSYSIEMLARTNVLCLDKTGTITDGTMILEDEKNFGNQEIDSNEIIGDFLNSFEDRNQTSLAILNKYSPKDLYVPEKKLSFSSSRKMSAVTFKDIGTFVLGAPEYLLKKDNHILDDLTEYTKQGYRVVLFGKANDIVDDAIIGDVKPIKAYIIKDNIRPEAHDTLEWFANNGVEIKIISGDDALTVSQIAKKAGVKNSENYISLQGKTLDEVKELALKYTVFGRVAPEQKAMIVQTLKKNGKTVGMTGDGVNDILALKKADCSIAIASGSEAARNVSQLVLLDNNFASLPKVVSEGRRVINNITAVASLFLMKTIFAIITTITTIYPFQPSHLLILEIFCIGLPSFFLALQPNDKPIEGGFLKNVLAKAIPGGLSYAVGVIFVTLMIKYNAFGLANTLENNDITWLAATVSGIYISFMGLITLLFHCMPINKFRVIIYSIMLGASIIVLFVPLFANTITHYNLEMMNYKHWVLILSTLIINTGLFIGLGYLFKGIIRKYEKRHN